jgi:murein DD-endopeptidase MepM/ murein hydrolase activator NlpD
MGADQVAWAPRIQRNEGHWIANRSEWTLASYQIVGCARFGEIGVNIIILTDRHGAAKTLTISTPWVVLSLVMILAMPVAAALVTWRVLSPEAADNALVMEYDQPWDESMVVGDTLDRDDSHQAQLERMTQQLGRLQTRLSRLDALGERLTELADLSDGEFDFNADPGMGGPELRKDSTRYQGPDVESVIESLAARIDDRTQQLRLLEALLLNRHTDANALLDYLPVKEGYISSGFGRRIDPISGRMSMHTGLDFAAPTGTPIFAVGAGVVTFSGRNGAYGNMVEITHGGGYKTRYAHAHTLKVAKGDVVQKGQEIATVGNTGRSTGPHLHLEVFRNGMAVNPARYIALQ